MTTQPLTSNRTDFDNANDVIEYYFQKGWTDGHWKAKRFAKNLPGFDCEVINGTGKTVSKAMKLKNLRGSYSA